MFVAALAFEGLELVAILDAITATVKVIQTFASMPERQDQMVNDTMNQKTFNQIASYNDQLMEQADFDMLKREKIIKIERHCESIWKYFPSGIASIFTWALTGQTTRHEFIVIETENHMGVMEMQRRSPNGQEIYNCDIQWWKCGNVTQKENRKNLILQFRNFERCQCSVNVKSTLTVDQLSKFINVVLFCWSKVNESSPSFTSTDPLQKVSRMFARSIRYFCEPQPDYTWILQSIFGCYTDKPNYIPRLDLIAIEKLMWHGQKVSDEKKQKLLDFEEIIKNIRVIPNNV